MIRHSVILKFKKTISDFEKKAFFDATFQLAKISVVQKFEVLNQISLKNKFEYGISMEFDSQKEYDFYSNHIEHQSFIQNYWLKYVDDFLEIDYTLFDDVKIL
jgi:hypothetical protein